MDTFNWAQHKLEEVTNLTKEQREGQANQRRLEQLRKKREKDVARAKKRSETLK